MPVDLVSLSGILMLMTAVKGITVSVTNQIYVSAPIKISDFLNSFQI